MLLHEFDANRAFWDQKSMHDMQCQTSWIPIGLVSNDIQLQGAAQDMAVRVVLREALVL